MRSTGTGARTNRNCYPGAIEDAFGIDVAYGQIEKHYGVPANVVEAARRYSPAQVVAVNKRRVVGNPKHISTSYIERQNLTLRMQQRRFTRLTNAFSKKLENHEAAVALYVCWFNLCRVHESPADHARDAAWRHRSYLEHRRVG